MAKNKKTRKEKKVADQRKKLAVTTAEQLTPIKEKTELATQLPTAEKIEAKNAPIPAAAISTSGYTYLFSDLSKTAILTSSIIIAEILIKFYAKI